MWLKLTLARDGSPLRLNSDLVEAYQVNDGAGTVLSTNDGGYEVKESLEEVDRMTGVIPTPAKNINDWEENWKKDLESNWK